jgi:hypothetical protein
LPHRLPHRTDTDSRQSQSKLRHHVRDPPHLARSPLRPVRRRVWVVHLSGFKNRLELVDQILASSNPLVSWLRCIERLMRAAQPATSSRAT